MPASKRGRRRGRPTERVKIDLPWEEAVKQALAKPKPPQGWPGAKKANPAKRPRPR
jgi:hypothetical protein